MPVDLYEALEIGRRVLDTTFAAPDEWGCEWDFDELPGHWVLIVDRIERYRVVDRFTEVSTLMKPIVIAKHDGSVERAVPSGPILLSRRYPEDFNVPLDRLPADYLFASHRAPELRRWVRSLEYFRFVREIPRGPGGSAQRGDADGRGDELALCLRCPDVAAAPAKLELLGGDARVESSWDRGLLRIAVTGLQGGVDEETVEYCRMLEARLVDLGWRADRADTTAADGTFVVSPRRYPELFG